MTYSVLGIHITLEAQKHTVQRSNNNMEVINNNSMINTMIIRTNNNNKSPHGIKGVTPMTKTTAEDPKEVIQYLARELYQAIIPDPPLISHQLNYMLHLVVRVAFNSSERCEIV